MSHCLECGAIFSEQATCQELFHQLLFWEAENPSLGVVHHLMVLGYHLQHPSLLSPEGLSEMIALLEAFVKQGASTDVVRKQNRSRLDSRQRKWKIKASASQCGAYRQPVHWTMTAGDVVAGGADNYVANVRRWAHSIHAAIHPSDEASKKYR